MLIRCVRVAVSGLACLCVWIFNYVPLQSESNYIESFGYSLWIMVAAVFFNVYSAGIVLRVGDMFAECCREYEQLLHM